MLIPRLMLSRTITHRSIRMSVQGLAIAAALLLSSCRPVTNVPRPTPNMPQSPAVAAVTPGVDLVPQGTYLFVVWTLEDQTTRRSTYVTLARAWSQFPRMRRGVLV